MTHCASYKVITRLDSIHHAISGLAGLGYGICEHWNDSRSCENEDKKLAWKQVLAISLVDEALVVSNTAVVGPHLSEVKEIVHWDLGFQRWRENLHDELFWKKVKEAIEEIPSRTKSRACHCS
jgi:hypothetical protein